MRRIDLSEDGDMGVIYLPILELACVSAMTFQKPIDGEVLV